MIGAPRDVRLYMGTDWRGHSQAGQTRPGSIQLEGKDLSKQDVRVPGVV